MIPSQANCNMADPREHVLWALAGSLVDPQGDSIITTEEKLRDISEILTKAGFRHHAELQQIKQIIPGNADGVHWLGVGSLQWVPMDTPETEVAEVAAEPQVDLDAMSAEQMIRLADDLKARGVIRAEDPPAVEGDLAQVGKVEVDDLP